LKANIKGYVFANFHTTMVLNEIKSCTVRPSAKLQ
jgi:hypothetical protein